MSRVEDDRDAERVARRLLEQKRLEESKKKEKGTQASQFSKLVGQQKEQVQRAEKETSTRSAIAHLIEHADREAKSDAARADSTRAEGGQNEARQHSADGEARSFQSKLGSKSMGERVLEQGRGDAKQGQTAKGASDKGRADAASSRSSDQSAASKGNAGRASDAKQVRESASERAEASDKASDAAGASAAGGAEKGDLKADADQGGKGGGQQSGGDKKGSDMPAGFRFNPALMAPPPVAQQNKTQGSDRLRRIATEIAQKIVEKVRVGTNALGQTEFQIDLRSNVLSGLSVKVSAKNGKISAVFSGSDRDVLKMLEEQEESLKAALLTRGLTLERFKVEAKA